jgi:hypothetical protein
MAGFATDTTIRTIEVTLPADATEGSRIVITIENDGVNGDEVTAVLHEAGNRLGLPCRERTEVLIDGITPAEDDLPGFGHSVAIDAAIGRRAKGT